MDKEMVANARVARADSSMLGNHNNPAWTLTLSWYSRLTDKQRNPSIMYHEAAVGLMPRRDEAMRERCLMKQLH